MNTERRLTPIEGVSEEVQKQQYMSLWHMGNEMQRVLSQLFDEETGEINPDAQAQLNALEGNAEKKMMAIGNWIKTKEAEKHQIEFMEEQLKQRKAAYDKEINRWQKYLMEGMLQFSLTKISCPLFTINLKENPLSTDVTDQTAVPPEFIRTTKKEVVTVSVDKNAVIKAFKQDGTRVPGTIVSRKLKLEILTDKI